MNTVHVIGNIGSEPEVKSFASQKKVARFSVAVNSGKKDKPTWIPCEMWDQAVERLQKCQAKAKLTGRKIQVTGALALNEYTKTQGDQQIAMKKLYVKVHSFELFGMKPEATEQTAEPEATDQDERQSA